MNSLLLKTSDRTPLGQAVCGFVLLALLLFGVPASAETVVEDIAYDDAPADSGVSVEPVEPLSADELDDLVGPIALYPDDLVAIVLPASTYPLQVVQAARFLEARKDDESLEPPEEWDDSIVALLNYPEVLELMNDDLDWTWKLGEAVLIQQEEVVAAVADFRERARVAGNLKSDEHQIVEVVDDGVIEIKPKDPEVIYVPYYEPSRVTVYHDYPVYHYYPYRYPVYYYPYPSGYAFSTGFFWGVTSAFSIGWHTHHLHQHYYGYAGHPYYGRSYYYDYYYYRRPYLSLSYAYYTSYHDHYRGYRHRHHEGNYWRPRNHRHGASPRHRSRYARHNGGRDSYRQRDRYTDRYGDRDQRRHERRRSYSGESSGTTFARQRDIQRDGGTQPRQVVADNSVATTDVQRRTRIAQLDGRKRASRDAARTPRAVAIERGRALTRDRHRNAASATRATRVQRQASRTDRTRARTQRNERRERVVSSGSDRVRRDSAALQRPARAAAGSQPQIQRALRQRTAVASARARSASPRASHSREARSRATPSRSAPVTQRASQVRSERSRARSERPSKPQRGAAPPSRSGQVASAGDRGRGSAKRSDRGADSRASHARAFRARRDR